MTLRAASCFSGIGAPEMGGPQFDWVWHAEIEPFPAAVMAQRHPSSVNLGDVLADDFIARAQAMGSLDLLAGGPPCQAFSVAGNRGGMDDARGSLTLRWVKILHAIQPRNAITENVPGWLSMPDNAFGCFLGALVGSDDALRSPLNGGKWPSAGMVAGPRARVAWRILDAQYFGVAQRRRRVFVVADFGNGADPAQILFERQGLHRHPPPRGQARESVAPTLAARTRGGGGLGTDFDLDGGLIAKGSQSRADNGRLICADIAPTLDAQFGDKLGQNNQHINGGGACSLPPVAMCLNAGAQQRLDPTFETLIPTNRCGIDVAHTLRGEGFDASEDETGRGVPFVTVEPFVIMERGREGGSNLEYRQDGTANTILTPNGGRGGMGVGAEGAPVAGTMKVNGDAHSGFEHGEGLVATAYRTSGNCGAWETGDRVDSLTTATDPNGHVLAIRTAQTGANGHGISEGVAHTIDQAQGQAVAFAQNQRDEVRVMDVAGALSAEPGMNQTTYVQQDWAVRRLTPVECARLQGFPDDYLDITYRNKPAADGNKYKALGNSWAVPCGAWIIGRIAEALSK